MATTQPDIQEYPDFPYKVGSGFIKTGPIRLGGDWPGYFFRGDEALSLARHIRWWVESGFEPDGLLIEIAERLETVRVNG